MSLQVYFDGTLINEKYYSGLTNNNELFNDSFKLGATACNQFKLSVGKDGVINQPSVVELRDDGQNIATLNVDNIQEKDYEFVYTLTDKMVNLNFNYDASEIFVNNRTTLYNIALDICTKVGLSLGTTDFRGYDKYIYWYDNTRTAREYIGMIAELNGGFARIEGNTLYFIKQKKPSSETISISDCEDFDIGEYHKITRVVYEQGALKYEYGDETGDTLYLNSDNVYITEQSEVYEIYNDIKDFEFYSFSTKNCPIDYSVKVGDVITFTNGNNSYPTIVQYDLDYFGGWIGGHKLQINTKQQQETQIIGDRENIRNLKIIVDRQNNAITQVVEEVNEQNTKISQTQQTVNELNSKIQDVADITTQAETIYASLGFTGINQSEPIEVKIHPTTQNISYLYPISRLYSSGAIYPSNSLYMNNRILRFTNTQTNEVFDYELPEDLLVETYSGVVDEFYLGYDQRVCQVIKRCGRLANGSVYELTSEEIHTYPYPSILLTDGDYTVELLGYNQAYLSVRLMAQNIYTTQFATKAELSSSITQTANEINLRVDEKLDEEDFTSANIMLKINNDESTAQINADKINLSGQTIDLTAENIKIESDNFSVSNNGKVTAKDISITGGDITLEANGTNAIRVFDANYNNSTSYMAYISNTSIGVNSGGNEATLYAGEGSSSASANRGYFSEFVRSPEFINTSKESLKTDIEKFNEKALPIIKNGDIYSFCYKYDKNKNKRLGFVIGEEHKYNTPEIVIDSARSGIDLYSMTALCWKAIKEQQGEIEQLQKEIEKMKGEKNEQD